MPAPVLPPTSDERPGPGWRLRLFEIIFESDTPSGRAFDVALLWAIGISVAVVILESVASVRAAYGPILTAIEWVLTILFTIEYIARLIAVRRPLAYVVSFYGIVDLLAVVPMYLELLLPGSHVLVVVRALRALRVFRILKLGRHLGEAQVLKNALRASRPKITVFLTFIISAVIVVGALMYLVEGPEHDFPDILTSMYWAVVTLCTVGYGDIVPQTPLGRFIAALLMVMGYGVIAVPTGILSAELARLPRSVSGQSCPSCAWMDHDADAAHCKKCGARL